MEGLLSTERISLRPAVPADKKKIFRWLAHSNLTAEMLGPPHFPDNLPPTWEEFDNDYHDHYFNGTQPLKGRCFIIIHNGQEIGQINYNDIDTVDKSTELDIWLADKQYTGQGWGPEALKIMCRYLNASFGCRKVYLQPSRRNANAISAYKKAGFTEQPVLPQGFIPDYYDSVLLELNIGK